MKIEEIEEALCSVYADLHQDNKDLAAKLIAVAKAAKLVCQGLHDDDYYIRGAGCLQKALKELDELGK